ncbi:SRPBCC family protein [Nocardioides sp. R-C-SC26]|uniref:SRPBCC family protein n=1 Tax=Nocardioides sp. R-C-SC26 TaxID=2870414 RepID=UPI001E429A25|nr:SRPBCC family protein [Nocardioides sp. R-C-SC26]
MAEYEELEQSIDIAATPAQVWALVSDVPAMARWSPQVVRSTVKGGVVKQGATIKNLNRKGPLFWPTSSKVVRFEPHRDFALRIKENRTIWSFQLEENAAGGTTLTQRRELPQGVSAVSIVLTKTILGGVDGFTQHLKDGMQETLAKIKAEAEASA